MHNVNYNYFVANKPWLPPLMESVSLPGILNIQPSLSRWNKQKDNLDAVADRQREAIQRFGIAGINLTLSQKSTSCD
jgi:hypothetical protein